MARRRGRRGGRGRHSSGLDGVGQASTAQPTAPSRDLSAAAAACLRALRQARLIAEALYAVTVAYVDDGELRMHRYDDLIERRLPLAHPDALLAVGCTAPHTAQHGPQVRIPRRVLDRLGSADVRLGDIRRGEMLQAALLGVAASVAARDEAGRAGRFAAGVSGTGGAVAIEELTSEAPVCAACRSAEAHAAWRARVERGARRREAEQAIRDGRRVFIDYGTDRGTTAKPLR